MSIHIESDSLDVRVRDAGLLINLLTGSGSSLLLNENWFADPFDQANLGGVGGRGDELVKLIIDFVGEAVSNPPNKASWHPVSIEGKPTGLNLVVETKPSTTASGNATTISLGLFHSTESGTNPKIDAALFIVLPLLTFDGGIWAFVLGKASNPAQVVGEVATDASFSAGSKTYNTLRVTGNFVLDGNAPHFQINFVAKNGSTVDAITSLSELLNGSAVDWINAVLGVSGVQSFLDAKIGSSTTQTIGSVLVAIKLLNQSTSFTVADLSVFSNQKSVDVAKNLLKEALEILVTQSDPLIPIGKDGGFWVVKESAGPINRYGIRTTLPDVGKSVGTGTGEKSNAQIGTAKAAGADNKPQAMLQIGKWFTGEDKAANSWLKRVDDSISDDLEPGAYVYLLEDNAGTLSLAARIELVSVGFDYVGGNETPLIDVRGAKVGGFEPRLYLALDLGSGGVTNISWGGGIRLDTLSLPLAGDFDGTTGDNAVASNLLASGDGKGGDAASGKEAAVNPSFSVSASGMTSEMSVQLYGPDNGETDRIWFPISRSFGPLNCKKIGVEWVDKERLLSFLFDGGVSLGMLDVELMGLSVGMKVTEPANLSSYRLGLDGLNVDYNSGAVEISGGFLKDETASPVAYSGQARVKAGNFGLGALGSYTTLPNDGSTSMFVFAFADFPLGGPGFFFVTGLAGGFGYNRSLVMPKQDEVTSMPFVAALTDPAKIGGKDATPSEALSTLKDWVPPTRGEIFLAAGIKFTTYELVNSMALVAAQFGTRFELDLLGMSSIRLPQIGPAFAYAELDLLVVMAPEEGAFRASLVVGSESFIIDPKCKLTGGFAFYAWFGSNKHAGEFVITLGGYHPAFVPPDYYPTELRLGFDWPVTDSLSISGGVYFALTPSCVMGGGDLALNYVSGGLKVWFTAHADFIIYWKPFYFDAIIGVSLGASYTFKVFGAKVTLGASLSADLEMWGPPTGGKVHVSWFVISFTIGFGDLKPTRLPAVDWTDFAATLPNAGSTSTNSPRALTAGAAMSPKVVSISIADGLQQHLSENGEQVWFVRPDEFTWFTKTTVPATAAVLGTRSVTTNNAGTAATTDLSVRPMGIADVSDGTHTITVEGPDDITAFDHDLDLESQPEAMWGAPIKLSDLEPSAKVIANCITGVQGLHPKPHDSIVGPPLINADEAFTFVVLDPNAHWLPLQTDYRPPTSGGAVPSSTTLESINSTLDQTATIRTDVFDALAELGLNAGANGNLTYLAANPMAAFIASPMTGSVA